MALAVLPVSCCTLLQAGNWTLSIAHGLSRTRIPEGVPTAGTDVKPPCIWDPNTDLEDPQIALSLVRSVFHTQYHSVGFWSAQSVAHSATPEARSGPALRGAQVGGGLARLRAPGVALPGAVLAAVPL